MNEVGHNPPLPKETVQHASSASDSAAWTRVELYLRAASVASLSEDEFVRRVRRSGIPVWPTGIRSDGMPSTYVTQVAVGSDLRRSDTEICTALSLTALRGQWEPGRLSRRHAISEWHGVRRPSAFDRDRILLSHPAMWSRMFADAGQFNEQLRSRPAWTGEDLAWAAGRLAGVFAVWSIRVGDRAAVPFAAATHELARCAQHLPAEDEVVVARRRARPNLGRVAYGLAQLDHSTSDPSGKSLLLLVQLVGGLVEIAKAHRPNDLARALSLARVATSLDGVCEQLRLAAHRQEHDRRKRGD